MVDLDDEKLAGLSRGGTDLITSLSSPDSSRQSVSQDSGVVSDNDIKEEENRTAWKVQRCNRRNSITCGRHSSISGGDTFSSRSGSGSSEDSDSTDAGSTPSSTVYPKNTTSIRSALNSSDNGSGR